MRMVLLMVMNFFHLTNVYLISAFYYVHLTSNQNSKMMVVNRAFDVLKTSYMSGSLYNGISLPANKIPGINMLYFGIISVWFHSYIVFIGYL